MSPADETLIGQNLVDVRNEARRSAHYEISPREREDEQLRDERDFGTQEYDDEAEQAEPRVWGDSAES